MATTQNEHSGNGTTRRFSFTFPYIKEDDVKVSVRTSNDDVTTLASTAYTFPSATEIQLNAVTETDFQESTGAPKTGVTLRVFRETDIDNPKAVFYPGSSVRAQDLNDNTLQNLYAEQERQNRAVDRIAGSTMQGNLTMQQSDIIFEGDTIDNFETTLTVVDPTTVMVTHLTETIKNHSYELLGRQEVKLIIDSMKDKYSAVVEEIIPDLMTIGEIQKVLQNLLKERVSIKDMVTILESLADNSRTTKDIEVLTEYVRFSLARNICNPLIDETGKLSVITLDPNIESLIANNIQKSMQGSFPALDPDSTSNILGALKGKLDQVYFYNNQPVILVSPNVRAAFRRLIEMVFPAVSVLSLNEVPNDVEIKTEGVVTL